MSGLVCFLSRPPERLGRNGLEIAAVAAEGGHYNSTVLPDCWKCYAIFRLKTGGTYRAFKHDGRRMAAHSHVDTWIVEMHLTLLRQVQKGKLCPDRRNLQTLCGLHFANHQRDGPSCKSTLPVWLSARPPTPVILFLCSAGAKITKLHRMDCTCRRLVYSLLYAGDPTESRPSFVNVSDDGRRVIAG